jgi:hypothetical protein
MVKNVITKEFLTSDAVLLPDGGKIVMVTNIECPDTL